MSNTMNITKDGFKNRISHCPICSNEWYIDETIKLAMTHNGLIKSPHKYNECYRYCKKDGVAISNGKKPSLIFSDFLMNIPSEISNLNSILKTCMDNCFCRQADHLSSKYFHFSNYKSEDAFTWAYFAYILNNNLQEELCHELGVQGAFQDILFWGTSFFDVENIEENVNRKRLFSVSDQIGEAKKSRTEPDIILITDKEIVFIEVKLTADNPEDKKLDKYEKYKISDIYKTLSKVNCLYELVRNWTLGNLFAMNEKKNFVLLNLLPEKRVQKEINSQSQISFRENLKGNGKYEILSWEKLFSFLDENYKNILQTKLDIIS